MSEYKKMRKIKKERRDKERVGKIKPRGGRRLKEFELNLCFHQCPLLSQQERNSMARLKGEEFNGSTERRGIQWLD